MRHYTLYIGGSGYYGVLFGHRRSVLAEAKRLSEGRAFILRDENDADVI
jgi:hypothetical protein